MKNTGQIGERVGYKVLLLLVVGLTAFSSAMKELNQLQQFAVESSHLVAKLADRIAPAQISPVPVVPQLPETPEIQHAAIEVETCELHQSLPSIDLPWLSNVARTPDTKPRAVVPRPSQVIDFKGDLPSEIEIAQLKKIPQIDADQVQFAFKLSNDGEPDSFVFKELPTPQFKIKTRRHRDNRMNPRDREIFLKTLNRSINLRFAS